MRTSARTRRPVQSDSDRGAKSARGNRRRRAIVAAAYDLVAEEGFENLRTREVAQRANITNATLHYHFPTKEDLVRGVVDRLSEELSATDAPSAGGGAAGTPLRELIGEFADLDRRLRRAPKTYAVWLELSARSARDASVRGSLDELDGRWREHVEGYLTEGVEQATFRHDLDVPATAAALIALVKGAILQFVVDPNAPFPVERVRNEMERWIVGRP